MAGKHKGGGGGKPKSKQQQQPPNHRHHGGSGGHTESHEAAEASRTPMESLPLSDVAKSCANTTDRPQEPQRSSPSPPPTPTPSQPGSGATDAEGVPCLPANSPEGYQSLLDDLRRLISRSSRGAATLVPARRAGGSGGGGGHAGAASGMHPVSLSAAGARGQSGGALFGYDPVDATGAASAAVSVAKDGGESGNGAELQDARSAAASATPIGTLMEPELFEKVRQLTRLTQRPTPHMGTTAAAQQPQQQQQKQQSKQQQQSGGGNRRSLQAQGHQLQQQQRNPRDDAGASLAALLHSIITRELADSAGEEGFGVLDADGVRGSGGRRRRDPHTTTALTSARVSSGNAARSAGRATTPSAGNTGALPSSIDDVVSADRLPRWSALGPEQRAALSSFFEERVQRRSGDAGASPATTGAGEGFAAAGESGSSASGPTTDSRADMPSHAVYSFLGDLGILADSHVGADILAGLHDAADGSVSGDGGEGGSGHSVASAARAAALVDANSADAEAVAATDDPADPFDEVCYDEADMRNYSDIDFDGEEDTDENEDGYLQQQLRRHHRHHELSDGFYADKESFRVRAERLSKLSPMAAKRLSELTGGYDVGASVLYRSLMLTFAKDPTTATLACRLGDAAYIAASMAWSYADRQQQQQQQQRQGSGGSHRDALGRYVWASLLPDDDPRVTYGDAKDGGRAQRVNCLSQELLTMPLTDLQAIGRSMGVDVTAKHDAGSLYPLLCATGAVLFFNPLPLPVLLSTCEELGVSTSDEVTMDKHLLPDALAEKLAAALYHGGSADANARFSTTHLTFLPRLQVNEHTPGSFTVTIENAGNLGRMPQERLTSNRFSFNRVKWRAVLRTSNHKRSRSSEGNTTGASTEATDEEMASYRNEDGAQASGALSLQLWHRHNDSLRVSVLVRTSVPKRKARTAKRAATADRDHASCDHHPADAYSRESGALLVTAEGVRAPGELIDLRDLISLSDALASDTADATGPRTYIPAEDRIIFQLQLSQCTVDGAGVPAAPPPGTPAAAAGAGGGRRCGGGDGPSMSSADATTNPSFASPATDPVEAAARRAEAAAAALIHDEEVERAAIDAAAVTEFRHLQNSEQRGAQRARQLTEDRERRTLLRRAGPPPELLREVERLTATVIAARQQLQKIRKDKAREERDTAKVEERLTEATRTLLELNTAHDESAALLAEVEAETALVQARIAEKKRRLARKEEVRQRASRNAGHRSGSGGAWADLKHVFASVSGGGGGVVPAAHHDALLSIEDFGPFLRPSAAEAAAGGGCGAASSSMAAAGSGTIAAGQDGAGAVSSTQASHVPGTSSRNSLDATTSGRTLIGSLGMGTDFSRLSVGGGGGFNFSTAPLNLFSTSPQAVAAAAVAAQQQQPGVRTPCSSPGTATVGGSGFALPQSANCGAGHGPASPPPLSSPSASATGVLSKNANTSGATNQMLAGGGNSPFPSASGGGGPFTMMMPPPSPSLSGASGGGGTNNGGTGGGTSAGSAHMFTTHPKLARGATALDSTTDAFHFLTGGIGSSSSSSMPLPPQQQQQQQGPSMGFGAVSPGSSLPHLFAQPQPQQQGGFAGLASAMLANPGYTALYPHLDVNAQPFSPTPRGGGNGGNAGGSGVNPRSTPPTPGQSGSGGGSTGAAAGGAGGSGGIALAGSQGSNAVLGSLSASGSNNSRAYAFTVTGNSAASSQQQQQQLMMMNLGMLSGNGGGGGAAGAFAFPTSGGGSGNSHANANGSGSGNGSPLPAMASGGGGVGVLSQPPPPPPIVGSPRSPGSLFGNSPSSDQMMFHPGSTGHGWN